LQFYVFYFLFKGIVMNEQAVAHVPQATRVSINDAIQLPIAMPSDVIAYVMDVINEYGTTTDGGRIVLTQAVINRNYAILKNECDPAEIKGLSSAMYSRWEQAQRFIRSEFNATYYDVSNPNIKVFFNAAQVANDTGNVLKPFQIATSSASLAARAASYFPNGEDERELELEHDPAREINDDDEVSPNKTLARNAEEQAISDEHSIQVPF
jgi:hypothetical protein